MEFGIEKCVMLVMKRGKRHMTDGMEQPNHDKFRTLGENETYEYLGILEADTMKQMEMKDKIRKEYLRRTRKLLECSPMVLETGSIPGHVIPKTLKMLLDTSLLNTQQYKVRIKGKVEQSRERSSAAPTPGCNSY